jgi:hypothetical protein
MRVDITRRAAVSCVRWAPWLTVRYRCLAAPRTAHRLPVHRVRTTADEGSAAVVGQAAAMRVLPRPPRRASNSMGSARWSSRSQYGQVWVPGP